MGRRADWNRARRLRRLAEGRCVSCGEPHIGPPTRCPSCREVAALKAKAKREQVHAEREAAGLPPRRRGWNGFQARPGCIRTPTHAEAQAAGRLGGRESARRRHGRVQAQAVEEAKKLLVSLRRGVDCGPISNPVDVLLRFWDRAYTLGYWKGWKQRKRGTTEAA